MVGSGPAGLAAAQQLNRAGHCVTVFEKADRIGGLLRYGIPNFKMEKRLLDRRMEQMRGRRCRVRDQRRTWAATYRATNCARISTRFCSPAAPSIRAICPVPGRELKGIHFAMEFLPQQNRRCAGDRGRRIRFWPPANAS